MAKKKITKKNILDQHFLSFCDMPYLDNLGEVIRWTGENEPMRYIFDKVRRYLIYDKTNQTWKGRNHNREERELLSTRPRIKYRTRRLFEKIEELELDLLPPQSSGGYSYIGDWESFKNSEIIWVLKGKKELIKYFVILALQQSYIVRDDDEFVGIDF